MHYNSISPGATTINASQGIAFFRQWFLFLAPWD
jgi:hypothetical protein